MKEILGEIKIIEIDPECPIVKEVDNVAETIGVIRKRYGEYVVTLGKEELLLTEKDLLTLYTRVKNLNSPVMFTRKETI